MKEYLTVTKLNQYIKSLVESDFSLMNIIVIGEVGSLTKHYTGHYYFTLKDESSQIKCMMFSSYTNKIDFNLENGMLILVQGYLGVYDKGGTYQLYCRQISLYGEGQYLLNLEKLKQKLIEEGVFDKPKKEIPFYPKRIGLISASTGAAMRDYITTIKSRLNTEIYLFPCLVQGVDAPKSILKAIKEALNYKIDLLVITRGGGSKEDLKVFNDETLVRFASDLPVPLITAIGHKIDTTLIDYVSSKSCITPTDAAINSVPSKIELENQINNLLNLIYHKVKRNTEKINEKIVLLDRVIELNSPFNKIKRMIDDTKKFKDKLDKVMDTYIVKKFSYYLTIEEDLNEVILGKINRLYHKYHILADKLQYLDPYSLLENGYGVITSNKKIISSINDVKINQTITIELKDGVIEAIVKEKK